MLKWSTDTADYGLWWSNVQIFHVSRKANDDGAVNTEEGARNKARVLDVYVGNRFSDIRRCPGLAGRHSNRPMVVSGINEGNGNSWVSLVSDFNRLRCWGGHRRCDSRGG